MAEEKEEKGILIHDQGIDEQIRWMLRVRRNLRLLAQFRSRTNQRRRRKLSRKSNPIGQEPVVAPVPSTNMIFPVK